jgi:hypothetical protein
MAKKKKRERPDYGAELERLVAERDAAEAEVARLEAQWHDKYMPEVKDLIRYGQERKHAWVTEQTGHLSPRTPEQEAEAKALGLPDETYEEGLLHFMYNRTDEVKRGRELGYEIELLERKIEETWEYVRLFGTPRVINLKDKPRPERYEYVYIGRGLLAGKERFPRSKWANRFTVKQYGRAEALARYEEEIRSGPLWDELPELEGKILACWCKPEPCHGDVLLRLIEERAG